MEMKRELLLSEQMELVEMLTSRASAGKHTTFEFVRSFEEFCLLKKALTGCEKIVEMFNRMSWGLYQEYCRQVSQSKANLSLLFTLRRFLECEAFYEAEIILAKGMLREYYAYVRDGHFLEQFVYRETRPEELLFDHREGRQYGK